METFYKITPGQAALIGKFEYAPNQFIDPFVNEQKDGTFLVSDFIYQLLKERSEIKKIDFTKLDAITKVQVDSKFIPK